MFFFKNTTFRRLETVSVIRFSAATQEARHVSWNPKVHCRFHKSTLLVHILGLINAVHTIPSHLTSLRFISIGLVSSQLRLILPTGTFPAGSPMCATCPANLNLLYFIIKLLIMHLFPTSHLFTPLRSKHSPQHPVLKRPHPAFLP
jgi:hypothetical protein